MSSVVLFVLLLALTFGVVVWVLRPSKVEYDIQRHLREIGNLSAAQSTGTSILKQEFLSSIPWMNAILAAAPGSMTLHRFIAQAGRDWSVGAVALGSFVLAMLAAAGTMLLSSNVLLALWLGFAAAGAPCGYLYWKRAGRFRRFGEQLPEAIDLIARALRAGHSVMSAIEVVSEESSEPLRSEFRTVFEQQNLGLPIREALLHLVRRVPIDDVRFVVTAILVQKETGGNLAEILDKAGAVMRDRLRLRGQLRVYTAQARMTGWLLCLLPFIVFTIINFVNHDYEKRLWTDPLGLRLVYAGLTMMALGIYAIRKIINVRL
ncbi:MAG TPA: type II secretion system F family protein [Candidatus Acidoferrales bacterium]|nr:type II secretion system F family protein [Candidatus Acidoferrales bacterium]